MRFTAARLIAQLALSAASTIFFVQLPAVYLCFCAAVELTLLHVNNEREQVCTQHTLVGNGPSLLPPMPSSRVRQDCQPAACNCRTVRLLRSAVYAGAMWSCAVTLATTVLPLPQLALAGALLALWLLTASYFGLLILFPHLEPAYESQAYL